MEQLINAFVSSQDNLAPERVAQAMEKNQDNFASNLNEDDLIAGFGVLEHEAKAKTFLAICDTSTAWAWLHHQIALHKAARNRDVEDY
jgi:hypothetical protein